MASEYDETLMDAVEKVAFADEDMHADVAEGFGKLVGQVVMYRAHAAYWEAKATAYREQLDWLRTFVHPAPAAEEG